MDRRLWQTEAKREAVSTIHLGDGGNYLGDKVPLVNHTLLVGIDVRFIMATRLQGYEGAHFTGVFLAACLVLFCGKCLLPWL